MLRTHFLIPIAVLSIGVGNPLFAEEGHKAAEGSEAAQTGTGHKAASEQSVGSEAPHGDAPAVGQAAHEGDAGKSSHASGAAAETDSRAAPGDAEHADTHGPSSAGSHEGEEHSEGTAHGEEGEAHGHHIHSHHLALFLGTTIEEGNLFPSLGVDYAFRIPSGKRRLGLTAFVELTAAEELVFLAGAGIEYHPIEPVKLIALAGLERGLGSGSEAEAEALPVHSGALPIAFPSSPGSHKVKTEAAATDAVSLVRLGIAYDFHVGSFSLTPSLFGDYVHEHFGVVVGLGLGGGF